MRLREMKVALLLKTLIALVVSCTLFFFGYSWSHLVEDVRILKAKERSVVDLQWLSNATRHRESQAAELGPLVTSSSPHQSLNVKPKAPDPQWHARAKEGSVLNSPHQPLNVKPKAPDPQWHARALKEGSVLNSPHHQLSSVRRKLPEAPEKKKKKKKYWTFNDVATKVNQVSQKRVGSYHRLSPSVVDKVKKFVFFVGYARSGHSIVGTLMDAHPHAVISNEFNLFTEFPTLNKSPRHYWKQNLYSLLYSRSIRDTRTNRANAVKGYSLKVKDVWQGKFDGHIDVIGDKSGDVATRAYLNDKKAFLRNYRKLKSMVSVPLRIIHTVRNPFDIVATSIVIMKENFTLFRKMKRSFSRPGGVGETVTKYNHTDVIDGNIAVFFRQLDAVMEMVGMFGQGNVLEVHNRDLVAEPRGTLLRVFDFLEVEATERYLDVCADKVFKSVSRSRYMLAWTPEQIERVERKMMEYDVLKRYSFTSD